MESLEGISKACHSVIREAGTLLINHFERPLNIRFKGQFNMVTEADLASERFILDALQQLTPDIPVMSEEEAETSGHVERDDCWMWVVDPLDGTTNFAHGFPHFCISIALLHAGIPQLGLIHHPVTQELWVAQRTRGASLNSIPCHVSASRTLESSILATGFPYRVRELEKNNLSEFCAFRLRSQGLRRTGAAALDLAYVASGRLDGFWERWLKPWDIAAGWLIVLEAGGRVTDFSGSAMQIGLPRIIASNGLIHEEMIAILTHLWPKLPSEYLDAL